MSDSFFSKPPSSRPLPSGGSGAARAEAVPRPKRALILLAAVCTLIVSLFVAWTPFTALVAERQAHKLELEAAHVRQETDRRDREIGRQALIILKGLDSVTTAGVNYRNYAPRVLDAKVQLDRQIELITVNRDLRQKLSAALALYVFASSTWNAQITDRYDPGIPNDGRIDLCPELARQFPTAESREQTSHLKYAQPELWHCAGVILREVESMLQAPATR